jgi:hypothetical protein
MESSPSSREPCPLYKKALKAHLHVSLPPLRGGRRRSRSHVCQPVDTSLMDGGVVSVWSFSSLLQEKRSSVSGIARRGHGKRSSEIPLATDHECKMGSGRPAGIKESHHLAKLGGVSSLICIIFSSRRIILIVSKKAFGIQQQRITLCHHSYS